MARWRLLAAFGLGLSLLPACGSTGSGDLVTEDRDVGDFDSIEVSGGMDLRLTVNPNLATSVIVTYDDNLIDRIQTEVDDSTLRIGNRGSTLIIGDEDRFVEVTVASLERLTASGGTTVIGEGDSPVLTLEASGGADVDLALLPVTEMTIEASGGASVVVHVTESISGEASGGSDLVIHGDPSLQSIDVSGGADVSRDDL